VPAIRNGQLFPTLSLQVAGGATVLLPDYTAGHFGVVLLYRGAWCPYCNAQLVGFQRAHSALEALDVRVVARSVDDVATTRQLVGDHGLSFPVGHSVDAAAVAAATGAYLSEDGTYLQSTGFVLAPGGTVLTAVCSSEAIGRLTAPDVVGMVKYLRDAA
jgi:peroxiredoxin